MVVRTLVCRGAFDKASVDCALVTVVFVDALTAGATPEVTDASLEELGLCEAETSEYICY